MFLLSKRCFDPMLGGELPMRELVPIPSAVNLPLGKRRQRGFVLITMGVAAVALFGALGMAVDLGRMFIAKNETQSFCDAAALAAALQLDGTTNGITKAQSAVSNSTNKWGLGSTAFDSPTVT